MMGGTSQLADMCVLYQGHMINLKETITRNSFFFPVFVNRTPFLKYPIIRITALIIFCSITRRWPMSLVDAPFSTVTNLQRDRFLDLS